MIEFFSDLVYEFNGCFSMNGYNFRLSQRVSIADKLGINNWKEQGGASR